MYGRRFNCVQKFLNLENLVINNSWLIHSQQSHARANPRLDELHIL